LRQALLLAPQHARAYYNLGVVLEKQGRLSLALASYRKSIDYNYPQRKIAEERITKIEDFLKTNG
jgi:Flp pilus assembly protein TadD